MSEFKRECEIKVAEVQKLLLDNSEWELRYGKYADDIELKSKIIKTNKQKFNEWAPLYLYMNVSEAKGTGKFSLRYLGQDVAILQVKSTGSIIISTSIHNTTNERDFGCTIQLHNDDWRSKEAKAFRNHFSSNPKRSKQSSKKNDEHRVESLLLTEFSKKSSKNKLLCNIQPVKLAGIARFQMPTPLSASNINKLNYSKSSGGGIDILSRIKKGNKSYLCIMEVKDENKPQEPPIKVLKQGLIYATFIMQLLRSKCGDKWWKLFGFNSKLPEHLELLVTCIMPSIGKNSISFTNEIITTGNVTFHPHYIYYEEEMNNNFLTFHTSLK
jgi:hypothetical protein